MWSNSPVSCSSFWGKMYRQTHSFSFQSCFLTKKCTRWSVIWATANLYTALGYSGTKSQRCNLFQLTQLNSGCLPMQMSPKWHKCLKFYPTQSLRFIHRTTWFLVSWHHLLNLFMPRFEVPLAQCDSKRVDWSVFEATDFKRNTRVNPESQDVTETTTENALPCTIGNLFKNVLGALQPAASLLADLCRQS